MKASSQEQPSHSNERFPPSVANPAFFLDVDGTLLELAGHPDEVVVPTTLIEALSLLYRENGEAVALISGRALRDLDRLFAPLRMPAAGQHGLERRDHGGRLHYHHELDARIDRIREGLQRLVSDAPGLLLEDKGFSLALHYRREPDRREQVASVIRELMTEAGKDFHVLEGKMVFEIKPGGRNKGTAITEFMGESPYHGRVPVFIGDDATDEDGFAVVNNLGGCSIKVGDGETAAAWRLEQPGRVLDYLQDCTTTLMTRQQ